MSLRTRLLAGMLVLVAVAIGAVSAITWVALRSFLISRVDNQLVLTPPDLPDRLCDRGEHPDDHPGAPHHPFSHGAPPVPILVTRLDPSGAVVPGCDTNGLSSQLQLTPPEASLLVSHPDRPLALDDGTRALARPGPDGGYRVVGLSMDGVDATLGRLLMLELLVGALTLGATAAVGAWGVGWGLRPLRRVTGTARAVAAEVSGDSRGSGAGLRRRVPEAPTGTEVGQLAEAFNTMLTAVEVEVAGRQDSEQRMRQFLADASHELRTPLTSLRGYAELITMRERRRGVDRDADSADALRRMTEEGARMSRLVEDLLVLARSDQGAGTTRRAEPVALDRLASDAVSDLRAAHPDRAITLDAGAGARVSGDPDQLRQILVNLLGNAAVHTAPGGPIRVGVDRENGQVRLRVADSGPGLTPSQAAHMFDRFWRADTARTRVKGGSGLGLAIVDTLVAAHGGSIDLDTSPDAGTTVTVTLPSAP
jgi:two-component system, OmpR family, sensor kinase